MVDSEQWISWDEASRLAGVPVPTIEHAVRVGRIRRREMHGNRPSLDRDSVSSWAAWYRDAQAERARRRSTREARKGTRAGNLGLGLREILNTDSSYGSDIDEWMSVPEAADALHCSENSVLRWTKAGALRGRFDGQVLLTKASVNALAASRKEDAAAWVSQAVAAEIVGCSFARVPELVTEGLLVQRPGPRWRASISRSSAEAAAHVWAARVRANEEARLTRHRARPTNAAPVDGQVWVTCRTAAIALGLTPGGVSARVRAGTLPGTRRGNRLWIRRTDVESAAAADAFLWRKRMADST